MGYKQSKYNFFFDAEHGTHLAFNAMSGGFARIKDENYDEIQKMLREKDYKASTEEQKNLLRSLIEGGFLIQEEIDEINILKMRNRLGRFASKLLNVTLMPTLRCNFKCVYCFERPQNLDMSDCVQERILEWIGRQIETSNGLLVAWYGGEPLLRFDIVKNMSQRLIRECNKKKIKIAMNLTTNGSLLTPDIIEELQILKVNFVQVTLDGPQKCHDARRPFLNGKGTFDIILNNILNLAGKVPMLAIRVNVDKNNESSVPLLLDILDKYEILKTPQVNLHFEGVAPLSDACANYATHFSMDMTSKSVIDLSKEAVKRGFNVGIINSLQTRKNSYCAAENYNQFVVGPEGELYKCSSDIGPTSVVGKIVDGGKATVNLYKLIPWLLKDPFEDRACKNCKFLPICMGAAL